MTLLKLFSGAGGGGGVGSVFVVGEEIENWLCVTVIKYQVYTRWPH